VAEFCANVTVSDALITSTVNGVLIKVDARALGVILGVPATGFDLYVREDKSLLSKAKLLELAQHLSQQPRLKQPHAVKKGDMQHLHQLIFWFIIKNIIPRAQRRNQADAMNQCLTDLIDRGEQINLPVFMITDIARIANTPRAHDLSYGFLLTRVFEHFGVELKKKVDAQVMMRWAAAQSWVMALISFGQVIPVMNRVCKHLFRMFLIPLPVSLLPQRLH